MERKNQEGLASVIKESVTMDTRKFLATINSSAQSQIAFFESAVKKLGEQKGREWRLTSLNSTRLVFEDVETSTYMVADHERGKGDRVRISNIKQIKLHEDKKPELFENVCSELVNALESEDNKLIESSFSKLAASRFRSTAIPTTGIVKTKDGVVRYVPVEELETPGRALADRIIESITDKIVLSEDGKIEGTFIREGFGNMNLGVSELTTRKLVAKYMQNAAANAYKSNNFQALIESTAGLICADGLAKAVENAAKFLREEQEFCLLSKEQWVTLIENSLAARGQFNDQLAQDTATLMFKTNLKVNRDALIESWRLTAQKAEHPVLLENVDILAEAEDFEEAYGHFLGAIFEAGGETTRGALITGLELLKAQVDKGAVDDGPTSKEIEDLITSLKSKGDSESTWKAMEVLDGVRRHIDSISSLDTFDEMPGPNAEQPESEEDLNLDTDLGADLGAGAGAEGTTVTGGGDKPLKITVEMDPAAMAKSAGQAAPAAPAAEPALTPEAGAEGGEGEGEESIDDILASLDDEGGEEKGGEEALAAGLERGPAISENEVSEFLAAEFGNTDVKGGVVSFEEEKIEESEEPEAKIEESEDDVYSIPEGVEAVKINPDYTTKVIDEVIGSDVDARRFADSLKDKNTEDVDELKAQAEAFVRENKKDALKGIADPAKQQEMVNQLAGEIVARHAAARQKTEGVEQNTIDENQFKSPLKQLSKRGLKRAAIQQLVKEGKLAWLDRTDDAVLGEYKGVKFVIDHSENPVAILSENGSVQVPVPENLVSGALYIAEASNDEADADDFIQWLDESIESLRDNDDGSLEEAIARITANADGSVEAEVETQDGQSSVSVPPVPPTGDTASLEPEMSDVPAFDGPPDMLGEPEAAGEEAVGAEEEVEGAAEETEEFPPVGETEETGETEESEETEEEPEEEEDLEEGKLPEALKQHQFKKKGEKDANPEKKDESPVAKSPAKNPVAKKSDGKKPDFLKGKKDEKPVEEGKKAKAEKCKKCKCDPCKCKK